MIVLRALGWIVGALAIGTVSGWTHSNGSLGRAAAEAVVNQTLSGDFAGELSVTVESFSWGRAVVRDFQVRDLDDQVVLEVERGELDFEPLPLIFDGAIVMRDIVVEGGRLLLRPGQEKSVSLSEAFSSPGPDDGDPSRRLDFGWMVARDFTVRVALTSPTMVFGVYEGSVQVVREEGGEVQVDLANVNGAMHRPSALGASIRIIGASGEIRPNTELLLDLDSGGCLGDHPLRVDVRYRKGPPSSAVLTLDYADGVGFLASVMMRLVARFSDTLEIDEAELPGSKPSCERD